MPCSKDVLKHSLYALTMALTLFTSLGHVNADSLTDEEKKDKDFISKLQQSAPDIEFITEAPGIKFGQYLGRVVGSQGHTGEACGFEFAGYQHDTNKTAMDVMELGLGKYIELMTVRLLTGADALAVSPSIELSHFKGRVISNYKETPRTLLFSNDPNKVPLQFISVFGSSGYVCKILVFRDTHDGLAYSREDTDLVQRFNSGR